MLNYLRVIIVITTAFFFTACDAPPLIEPGPELPEPPEPAPEPPEPFELSGNWLRYAKLIPSTQIAFCGNLQRDTKLDPFKFKNWIAKVDAVSNYGNNEYKVKLDTPCSSIETKGKWIVLPENPIFSQLAKVEKGQPVFISGSYTVKKNISTVDLNYFSIVW
jgi:hypothetical protein